MSNRVNTVKLVIICCVLAPYLIAYVPTYNSNGQIVRWPVGPLPQIHMSNEFANRGTFSAALSFGTGVWDPYLNNRRPFQVSTVRVGNMAGFGDGIPSATTSESIPFPYWGFTFYFSPNGTTNITDADIVMYPTIELRTVYDAHSAILHELGHFVGLDHSQYTWALMAVQLSANWRVLSSDEVKFMKDIYGYVSPCSGCCCPGSPPIDPRIQTFATAFRGTIDSTLYASGTQGEQWVVAATEASGEAAQLMNANPSLYYDVMNFLINNESFAGSQMTTSPELLTHSQISGAARLLYRIADSSSAELRDAIFKIVAVLHQSEGKTFKQTIEDVLRGVTIPWNQIIQWLIQNYPNPFNPSTTILYRLTSAGYASLKIYDVAGKEVATLAEGYHGKGIHQVQFDGTHHASGVYFYRLVTPAGVETRKMLLVK